MRVEVDQLTCASCAVHCPYYGDIAQRAECFILDEGTEAAALLRILSDAQHLQKLNAGEISQAGEGANFAHRFVIEDRHWMYYAN